MLKKFYIIKVWLPLYFLIMTEVYYFQKLGFREYKREEAVKMDKGQFIDDIYLKLELWVLEIKLYPKMKESIV